LDLITKRVSNESGDARTTLNFALEAVQYRLARITDAEARSFPSTPLIKIAHVAGVIKQRLQNTLYYIENLSLQGKVVLCTLVTLAEAKVQHTTIGKLKSYVTDCLQGCEHLDSDMADFHLIVETLVDQGLLNTNDKAIKKNGFSCVSSSDLYHKPIFLGIQDSDVVDSVKKSMRDYADFFDRLRQKARSLRTL
jgi:Cdc6-like AAA superfamily ATPase